MNRIKPAIIKSTEKLKDLIEEHPDYPIAVLAGEEANGGDHSWMFCSDIQFEVGELLDCDYYDYGDCVITDRGRLEEVIEDRLYDDYVGKPEAEYEAAIKQKMNELEKFWTPVIAIYADN